MQLVSSAENSTKDWRAQYGYIEDIHDGRGYTAGLIGFTSATDDMVLIMEDYTRSAPDNALKRYTPALRKLAATHSSSHDGLDPDFVSAWRAAAGDVNFRRAQDRIRDGEYFNPAVARAKADGLSILGQFMYYDAMVMHGSGDGEDTFTTIRKRALRASRPPSLAGDETRYLNAFLDERVKVMRKEEAHNDTARIELAQRRFLREGNFNLKKPLVWRVNDEVFSIR